MKPTNDSPQPEPDVTNKTDFELAWSKTVHEFDIDKAEPQQHTPRQEGSHITCATAGHHHGFDIGPNKNLVFKNGKYFIEPVIVRQIGE